MTDRRWIAGVGLGVLVAAGIAVAPAIGAPGRDSARSLTRPEARFGGFTPASADPRLAAILAKSGLESDGFRFTPSESRKEKDSVSVAVRASTDRGTTDTGRRSAVMTPDLTLAPIEYNLGVAVGWKRFTLTGDLAKLDLAGQPGSRESAAVGVSYSARKFTGRVSAQAARPITDTPMLIAEDPNYSIDVGGSYSLTRNIDVTAGVRYRSDENRLTQLPNDRRDSQAVYIGTAFRF